MSETYDFNDGNGPVPAHKHPNGGGWVADTATVADTAYVGRTAHVYGTARVYGYAQVCGNAQVFGNARVSDKARVYGNAGVGGNAWVGGNAHVYGEAWVYGNAPEPSSGNRVGLTRREYFAIQIVSALLVSSPTNTANAESICEVVAKAFLVADQMERVSDRGSI